MISPNCTLATSCFDLTKYHKSSRPLHISIQNMETLLQIPCYLVIFCDSNSINLIKNIRNDKYQLQNITHYIEMKFEDIFYYKYLNQVKENREKYHPTQDERTCSESHLLTINKFDFVQKTIQLNPFQTTKFGWIDSNIGVNASKISQNYQPNQLLDILNRVSDKFHIQILNVTDKKYKEGTHKKEYYQQYRWVVCGCLFTTGPEIGIKILNRLHEIFVTTTNLGYGHGEEMIYLEILDEFYYDIERSYGDYHHILNNFIEPTVGYHYINECIIKKYLQYGYHKECCDCCQKVIKVIEKTEKTEIDYSLYLSILLHYYIALYYYSHSGASQHVHKIINLVYNNDFLREEFDKNKEFYLSQFRVCVPLL